MRVGRGWGKGGAGVLFSHYPLQRDDVQDLYKQLSMDTNNQMDAGCQVGPE